MLIQNAKLKLWNDDIIPESLFGQGFVNKNIWNILMDCCEMFGFLLFLVLIHSRDR